jgi:hypothetical protein
MHSRKKTIVKKCLTNKGLRAVWFVANYVTLCLRLVVQIEELTLGKLPGVADGSGSWLTLGKLPAATSTT